MKLTRRIIKDPLNLIAFVLLAMWLMAIWQRPIGDYSVETDFYGNYVHHSRLWASGQPTIQDGYHGPFYTILLGYLARALSVLADEFYIAKLLSVICAVLGIRIFSGILRSMWGTAAAIAGGLFVAANEWFAMHAVRACIDLLYWLLLVAALCVMLVRTPSVKNWAIAGVLIAAAFLTRYNGVILIPVALLAAAMLVRPWKLALRVSGIFMLTFIATCLPWWLYLWNQVGDPFWNRAYYNVAVAAYLSPHADWQSGRFEGVIDFRSLWEVVRIDPTSFAEFVWQNAQSHAHKEVQLLLRPPWAIAVGLGFLLHLQGWFNRRAFVLLAFGVLTCLSMAALFYSERFMLPNLILWAAGFAGLGHAIGVSTPKLLAGLTARSRWTPPKRWKRSRISLKMALTTTLLIVMSAFVVKGIVWRMKDERRANYRFACPEVLVELIKRARMSGFVIIENTPIAASKPHVPYYLNAPFEKIGSWIPDIRERGAHYMLVSDMEIQAQPTLRPLLTASAEQAQALGLRIIVRTVRRYGEEGKYIRLATLCALDVPKPPQEERATQPPRIIPVPEG